MKKYVELDSLWKCETCFHNKNGKCSQEVWCDNGEGYRPAYDKLPIVELDPVKHGRWYLADDGDGVVCDECGTDFCVLLNEVMMFKYCPNCGAYMREMYLENLDE